jgi:hypothetical protein
LFAVYEILENPKMMSKADIVAEYRGKWVYIVKANVDAHGTLIEGMPVVTGEWQFDGVEDGIYNQFDGEQWGDDLSYSLIPQGNTIDSGFTIGVL